jgi:RpiR family carbohydrate utilization transcriptional regulator
MPIQDRPETAPAPAGTPVLVHIRAHRPGLQPGEAKVADVLLSNPEVVLYSSVTEVAELASTSTATVVRCAQKLGYQGFQALKIALARELAVGARAAGTEAAGILAEVTSAGAQCVRDAAALVPTATFDRVAQLLADAERVLFTGVGTSAPLCQDAAYRFTAIGLLADYRADVHGQALACRLLGARDVCVAVSHTGATRETLEATRTAREAGATIITLTSFARSPITELSDEVLLAGTRELGPGGLEAMASRLAHLAVLDALIVAVVRRDPDRAARALQAYGDVLSEHRL